MGETNAQIFGLVSTYAVLLLKLQKDSLGRGGRGDAALLANFSAIAE